MTVSTTSKLVSCDSTKMGGCRYMNSVDNSTFALDCACTLNAEGDSNCPAARADSNLNY